MEIETLSNYEQSREKSLDNTMDLDLQTNEEESVSPVNKVYEENSESRESKEPKTDKGDKEGVADTLIESESDEEDEEEEEKLLLSPAHSDYGGDPLSPVNRDLLDSDCEGEKEDYNKSEEKEIDTIEEEDDNKTISNESKDNVEEKSNNEDNVGEGEDDEDESDQLLTKESEENVEKSDKDNSVEKDESDQPITKESEDNVEEKLDTNETDDNVEEDESDSNKEKVNVDNDDTDNDPLANEGAATINEEDKPKNEERDDGSANDEEKDENKEMDKDEEGCESISKEDEKSIANDLIVSENDKTGEANLNTEKSATSDKEIVHEKDVTKKDREEKAETVADEKTAVEKETSEEKTETSNEEKAKTLSDEKVEFSNEEKAKTSSDEKVEVSNEEKSETSNESKAEKDSEKRVENDKKKLDIDNTDRIEVINDDSQDTVESSDSKVENGDDKKDDNVPKAKRSRKKGKETKDKKGKRKGKDQTEDGENSLLKETLSRPPDADEDIDMDEDFDPSLLMPELSMEVDEAPVITNNYATGPEPDGSKSPLRLYDPIFSTFVDEMTGAEVDFDLTAEELELKARTYGEKNAVQFTKIHCTACNIHLGSALDGQGNRFVHPLLKVLICKKCFHFYTSGEFEKDEDGSELYCRWCGQGGQVMCCSNCEMVFCKKCIRINFDRKKLSEIKNSDDWMCFSCNPSQLIHLRIHCAEFMEYVQREIRHVGSAPNPEAYMNTDYCQCCLPQKRKAPDAAAATPQAKRRRRAPGEDDPDYNPLKDREEEESPPVLAAVTATTPVQPQPNKMPTLTPRPPILNAGLTTRPALRHVTPQQTRPRVQMITPTSNRPPPPGYIRVSPGGLRLVNPSSTPTMPTRPPALRPIRPTTAMPKHEWFEKTVRAAARVNSNLSYTLTQLNRAQANATSVEALAVVHNKLQEILSSSINSLIQIRKNLRTEFIAGIKNIRFPPKTQPTSSPQLPASSKDDDDVIFVPSDPPPPPVPIVSKVAAQTASSLPPGITLTKRNSSGTSPIPKAGPSGVKAGPSGVKAGPSGVTKTTPTLNKTPASTSTAQPKGFLRVKSFSALQNVPSECITIPDDPPEDPDVQPVIETDPLAVNETPEKEEASHTNGMTNGDKDGEKEDKGSDKVSSTTDKDDERSVKRRSSAEESLKGGTEDEEEAIKKIKKAKIVLERSNEIDELVKNKFGLVNGTSDESVKN